MINENPAPGWYVDPDGLQCERFWDGSNWTLQTRPKVLTQATPATTKEQKISAGWWATIIVAGVLCFIMLVYLASDPSFY